MADNSPPKDERQLPSKQASSVSAKVKKIPAVTKDAAAFMATMEKKKAGPNDIASALEQWLNNE